MSYRDGTIEKTTRLKITIKQSYKVIITATAESDKYYAETDQPSYYEGETVHLHYGAEDGYYINKVEIDGENIDRLYIGYDFVMPAHDVVVKLYVSDQYDEGDPIPYPDDPSARSNPAGYAGRPASVSYIRADAWPERRTSTRDR